MSCGRRHFRRPVALESSRWLIDGGLSILSTAGTTTLRGPAPNVFIIRIALLVVSGIRHLRAELSLKPKVRETDGENPGQRVDPSTSMVRQDGLLPDEALAERAGEGD